MYIVENENPIDINANKAEIFGTGQIAPKNGNCLNCEYCFKKNNLFALLDDSEIEILNKSRVEVFFKKGEIIYKEGMPLTHLFIIRKGFGKIYINGSNGKNLILTYTKLYSLNGGIGVFTDQLHHSTLMASSDCETCLIDIHSFNEVMHHNQAFMDAFLKEYSERVQQTYRRLIILTQKNMEARMAEAILHLKETQFANGFIENINKLDLAEFTAMSKESAIRVLKEFKDENYIDLEGQNISIKDAQALENISLYG